MCLSVQLFVPVEDNDIGVYGIGLFFVQHFSN